jgi:hypothetical protein
MVRENEIRDGEVAVDAPAATDAGLARISQTDEVHRGSESEKVVL